MIMDLKTRIRKEPESEPKADDGAAIICVWLFFGQESVNQGKL